MKELINYTKKLAKDYDIYLQSTEINEIQLQKNKINFTNKAVDSGYGVRILKGGLGFSASNVKSEENIQKTVIDSLKSAEITEKVKFRFPEKGNYPEVKTIDRKIRSKGGEAVKEYSEKLINGIPEDVLLSFGKIRSYDSVTRIINSEGLEIEREDTNFMVELSLIVKKNNKRMEFWPHEYRRRMQDIPMSHIDKWVKLAYDQTIAKEPETEKTTVVFSPSVVLDGLGSVIGGHVTGSSKVNDVSKFSVDDKIASPKLTVISDGLYPYGLMSGEFDDEGVPQRKVPLIVDGVFKGFVYDQFYAMKDNTESTGNGLKQSGVFFSFEGKYGAQPGNQVSNFYVKPGKVSYDDMIEDIQNGVLVEQFSWLNPDVTTGKFSSEIRAGYYIKNGEIKEPIKGGLVIGNIFDMIKRIDCISNKSVICSGGTVFAGICPYISFEDVQIAGK